MDKISFSEEQKAIFDYAEHGILNMIVQAVAGAGKTTTLVECANRIRPDRKVMLLAHNRSTRDTLLEKIGHKDNIKVFTLHGLAYRMFVEYFGKKPEIDDNKYRNYINKNIDTIGTEFYLTIPRNAKLMYKANVFSIIDKARHNLKKSERELKRLAEKKYNMILLGDECAFANQVLEWGYNNTDVVDFQDLLWYPSQYGYFTKIYTSDIIMLDEAQDASIAQQDVVSRCFKRETRMFSFGDRDQTINSWCGSDTESFEHLKDPVLFRRDSIEFPLTTNYRCGTKIIEYAKQYTDNNIHARVDAPEGEIHFNSHINDIKNGDMVLCRNISPLMEFYRIGVANGKKMYFKGEELGKTIIETIDCSYGETPKEIVDSLKHRLINTWDFFTEETGLDRRETMTNPIIISMLDTIKTIENFPKTVENRKDIEKFISEIFSNEENGGLELSTIHRAKGLEANNVFIICPSLIPSKLAESDWEIEEEKHLQYVMCTRAKNSLNFVSEKEIKPKNFFSEKNVLFKELEDIRTEIGNELSYKKD